MTKEAATAAQPLRAIVEDAFERRGEITPGTAHPELVRTLRRLIEDLGAGRIRVAEKQGAEWITHQWVKKAVLLYFRTHDNQVMATGGGDAWFDKVPLKFQGYDEGRFRDGG